MANWYCRDTGTLGYSAVAKWAALTTYAVGAIVRQLAAPSVGNERCFRASSITTGISGAAEPTWVLTKGSTTSDAGVTWTEITGTNIYNGDGGGSNWGAPSARVEMFGSAGWGAITAGDSIFLGSDHSQTAAAALTFIPTSTPAAQTIVACIATATIPPTNYTTGASVATTGTNAITFGGANYNVFMTGITWSCGAAGVSASLVFGTGAFNFIFVAENCTFSLGSTSGTPSFNFATGARDLYIKLRSCTYTASTNGARFNGGQGNSELIGGTFFQTGTVPTTLVVPGSGLGGNFNFRDCDLSKIVGQLVSISSSSGVNVNFYNCKLANAVSATTGSFISLGGERLRIHNCDSAATNYRVYVADYAGTLQQSTSIYRTNGATDLTTPLSWQIVSTANSQFYSPFIAEEIGAWNTITGSAITATVYLTTASTLTNSKAWVEWEYLGDGSFPDATADQTSRLTNNLASPTNLTTDSVSTWTGGLGNNYKISVTFTPQMAGFIKARINIGGASLTINVDPKIEIANSTGNIKSSGRQFITPGWGYTNETAPSLFSANMVGGTDG